MVTMFHLHICLCITCTPGALEENTGSLELGLQMVMSFHRSPVESRQCSPLTEPIAVLVCVFNSSTASTVHYRRNYHLFHNLGRYGHLQEHYQTISLPSTPLLTLIEHTAACLKYRRELGLSGAFNFSTQQDSRGICEFKATGFIVYRAKFQDKLLIQLHSELYDKVPNK